MHCNCLNFTLQAFVYTKSQPHAALYCHSHLLLNLTYINYDNFSTKRFLSWKNPQHLYGKTVLWSWHNDLPDNSIRTRKPNQPLWIHSECVFCILMSCRQKVWFVDDKLMNDKLLYLASEESSQGKWIVDSRPAWYMPAQASFFIL